MTFVSMNKNSKNCDYYIWLQCEPHWWFNTD